LTTLGPSDPAREDVKGQRVSAGRLLRLPGGHEAAEAYVALPPRPRAAVIVIHEVWGLDDYVRSACERLKEAGFAAYAPALYWREKGLFTPARVREAMRVVWDLSLEERHQRRKLDYAVAKKKAPEKTKDLLVTLYDREFRSRMLGDVVALARHASKLTGRVGVVGFSMGGGLALRLAAAYPPLRACAVFSAEPPGREVVKRIRAPVLAMYGSDDHFMTRRVPEFVGDALESGMDITLKTYPSAGHEFFRWPTGGHASEDAWRTAVAFLDEKLA